MSEAFRDIGPAALSRPVGHQLAREIGALAGIAADLTMKGPQCNVMRATDKLREARDLLNRALGDPA